MRDKVIMGDESVFEVGRRVAVGISEDVVGRKVGFLGLDSEVEMGKAVGKLECVESRLRRTVASQVFGRNGDVNVAAALLVLLLY